MHDFPVSKGIAIAFVVTCEERLCMALWMAYR